MWRLSQGWFPSITANPGDKESPHNAETADDSHDFARSGVVNNTSGCDSQSLPEDGSGSEAKRQDEVIDAEGIPKRTNFELVVARVRHSLYMKRLLELISRPPLVTCQQPLWLLGVCYTSSGEDEVAEAETAAKFLHDFESRLWLTYRRDFAPMGEGKLTSDAGWGCMLRSGQMLLAQALVNHRLGRDWRLDEEQLDPAYLHIVESFGDAPGPHHPFSIHNLISVGAKHGLTAGAWLGPYVLCRTLESLTKLAADSQLPSNPSMPGGTSLPMAVCVVAGAGEGDRGGAPMLCLEDVVELCMGISAASGGGLPGEVGGQQGSWLPVLILVPLMLGHGRVNPRYLPSLSATFAFPQSLGVLGGKPGGATYLVGVQESQLLYLDPHQVHPTVLVAASQSGVDTSTYHCRTPRMMPLEAVDPSLALGFYCRDQADLEDFCERANELAESSSGAPMFTVGRRIDRQLSNSFKTPESGGVQAGGGSGEEDWQFV